MSNIDDVQITRRHKHFTEFGKKDQTAKLEWTLQLTQLALRCWVMPAVRRFK